MEKDLAKLLGSLDREEKAALVAGTDFMFTNPIPRLGIPSLRMSDGPHGLRVQNGSSENGVTASEPATCFPTAATLANSWNPERARLVGSAIAAEARHYGINLVLGPGINIKRNPRGGRNFEYFSEDPYLTSEMAIAEIEGIQSGGVGTSLKHFALNNSETYRFNGDSIADERTMAEIYLKAFERTVKEAKPSSIMCSYNKINGVYASENGRLLTEVLRDKWGYEGAVMTDWGATHDRVKGLKAGLDLEMPGDTAVSRKAILDSLEKGSLEEETLDKAVGNVLRLVEGYAKKGEDDADFRKNAEIALEAALDSAVLLKNEGVLPLKKEEKVFVCGDLFRRMRYQGAGSSMINPFRLCTPEDAFKAHGVDFKYARGYRESESEIDEALLNEALEASEGYRKVLVFIGLTDLAESEGSDRPDMKLPANQAALVEGLLKKGKDVVAVLFGGAPFLLPFASSLKGILHMYLPGQEGGEAAYRLLFGLVSPSGRLAETWPLTEDDVPFDSTFGKGPIEVYREGIYVGYRYYATARKQVLFPFGYGLSYSSFAYSGFSIQNARGRIKAKVEVKNVGKVAASEVVELYSASPGIVFAPAAELRAFRKVFLAPGERKTVEFDISIEDLRYFDPIRKEWSLQCGEYSFFVGKDAMTPLFVEKARIEGFSESPYSKRVSDCYGKADFANFDDSLFVEMASRDIPKPEPRLPISLESRFSDLKQTFFGKILYRSVLSVAYKQRREAERMEEGIEKDNKKKGAFFLERILDSNSLITMSMSAGKSFPHNFAQGFVELSNGHLLRGIRCFCAKIKVPALPKEKEKR